jgi:drug/metabolite transporter (DMT)-like permease
MSPLVRGALLALASALAFGATAPLIGRFGAHTGTWTVAALLYAGAALAIAPTVRSSERERRVARADFRRIALAGVLGAMLAPAALVWGIAHTGAMSASLVLALESAFTVAIAAVVFHEHIGGRVVAAVLLITAGAVVLVAAAGSDRAGVLGIAAVAAATFLWAIDNALTGTVATADPSAVVVLKSSIGCAGAFAASLIAREPMPSSQAAIALAAAGAIGFGASLRWYLLAQRSFGIARTASLFAVAPFAGAAIAYVLGQRTTNGAAFAVAALLVAGGVVLHVRERHEHAHRHDAAAHEHAHTHDDGHHDHTHAVPPPAGAHSHPHEHRALVHAHPHAPDVHHLHDHPGRPSRPEGRH